MGTRLEWTTGSNGLRRGAREETRYAWPPSLHAGAAVIAAASPVVATVVVLCAALLAA
ncbi:hypothetical protein [Methylobacterium sp. J-068]|uniref:hypothetical protein n=1 Tax=Methylobacterium sp. J-068 TaxID=2836649 RepID=UPI001FBBD3DB|nr:hypothetical protein [Methylobacterium sp. J-068]MCJ2036943.1 hypothetical protein [Methylobacterium sp. J-068]